VQTQNRPAASIFFFLSLVLAGQDHQAFVSTSVRRADALRQQITDSNPDDLYKIIRAFTALKQGLERMKSEPGKITPAAASDLISGLSLIAVYMSQHSSMAQDNYLPLCHDVLKAMIESGFDPIKVYCPSADNLYAARPKQRWPDITEKAIGYWDGQALFRQKTPRFLVSGTLGPVYRGVFENVADDLNTRNYIGSVVTSYVKNCPQYDNPGNAVTISKYYAYYEMKAQEKMKRNPNAFFTSLAEIFRVMSAHGSQAGLEDGETIIKSYHCGGDFARSLFARILDLAQRRNDMPPDVPNNGFFKRQFDPDLHAQIDLPYSDSDSELMRSVRSGCEDTMTDLGSNNVVGRGQEGYCRCQAQMLMQGGVPRREIQSVAARFSKETLNVLAQRYPAYKELQPACYD